MRLKELLAEIKEQVNQECISNSCSGDGCDVSLTDVPPDRVIVDLECEFKRRKINTKRCDYVIFYANHIQNSLVVVLIELKSGTFKAQLVADQLQGAADFAVEVFEKLSEPATVAVRSLKITCIPVLFYGKGIDKSQRYKLERAKVGFYSQKPTIKRRKCGEAKNLALVLKG